MREKKLFNILLLSLAMGLSSQVMAQSAGQYVGQSGEKSADCSSQDPTKRSSKDSSCISPGLITTQIAQPKINSADAITPFGTAGASCVTPWGQTIPDYSGVMAFLGSTGTYNYSTGVWAGECQEEFRYCAGGQLSGSYQYQSCDIGAVNGTCGYASGSYYTYPTTGPATNSLCNPQYTYGGVPPAGETPPSTAANSNVFLSGNTYSWTCAGENGGSSASCAAYRRINAQCGSNNGTASRTTPPASCDLGNSTGISGSGPWSWSCMGVNGGANSSCYVNRIIDGVCGSSNGATLASAPGSGLCNSGNASGVGGSGPWSWSCTGTNGGNTANCSATQPTIAAYIGKYTCLNTATGQQGCLLAKWTVVSTTQLSYSIFNGMSVVSIGLDANGYGAYNFGGNNNCNNLTVQVQSNGISFGGGCPGFGAWQN